MNKNIKFGLGPNNANRTTEYFLENSHTSAFFNFSHFEF